MFENKEKFPAQHVVIQLQRFLIVVPVSGNVLSEGNRKESLLQIRRRKCGLIILRCWVRKRRRNIEETESG